MSDAARVRAELAMLLAQAEHELRALGLWEGMAPAPERLASEIPFCHDTLAFTQWIQWVFIPRFRALLEGGHPLPGVCAVAPIAGMAFADIDGDTGALLDQLQAIDSLVTGYARQIGRK